MNPIRSIVEDIFEVGESAHSVIVFDEKTNLSKKLTALYREVLPNAEYISFDETSPEHVLEVLEGLKKDDFVALIQSGSFRLNEFRIRVELFKKGLKVIEHPHLKRMLSEKEEDIYLDALAYDKEYYRTVGHKLKERIDRAKKIVVMSEGAELVYTSAFEDAKLNVGDYTGMKNWGGQFPIGEVFTEPSVLSEVNGTAKLIGFGDRGFLTHVPPVPVEITVKEGVITDVKNSNPEFDEVLKEIRAEEAVVGLRELGFGMNRAMTRERMVSDIGTFERMCGIHLSLGAKHTIYAKKEFSRKHSRFHVDVFVGVTKVLIDDEVVFENGAYTV